MVTPRVPFQLMNDGCGYIACFQGPISMFQVLISEKLVKLDDKYTYDEHSDRLNMYFLGFQGPISRFLGLIF